MQRLERESKDLEYSIIELCYHMNGGITWEEAWGMSPAQRQRVVKFLEAQMKERAKALTGKEYM